MEHQGVRQPDDPSRDFGEPHSLVERFEEQVEKSPDAVALEFERARLSYRELNLRANRLAWHLRRLGVGPDVLVGVCLERSLEMVIALIAVLKAGGAYVPLNPAHPPERLAFLLEDAEAEILVTERRLKESLSLHRDVRVCLMDQEAEPIGRESDRNPDPVGSAESLAYVIYTSGSSGKPKGVAVTHANVDRLFTATQSLFGFGSRDVWTLFHSYAFDFSVWELWGALRYGGRLVIVAQWVARSAEAFHDLLVRSGVTVLNQTPSAFGQLIPYAVFSAAPLRLRLVIFGGETLEPAMLKPWIDRYGDESPRLVNMYGITETTVHVTYHRVTRRDLLQPDAHVIGRPIPDLQVYVLDRQQLCPIGVPGELHVAGAGLARGYLRRPELTRERFIPNPFGTRAGERLYRSGDLARCLPNGEIEYLGRIDDQVKIRGHRIELGEIESVLSAHPAVRRAVVVAREDAPGDPRLVAYLVGAEGAPPSGSEMRAFLRRTLPDYMLPSAFVSLESFPLTPNGKIDRRALPPPDRSNRLRESIWSEPRGPIDAPLAAIWSEVLGVERIGTEDDFFALGGHSLHATKAISRIRESFGVELPLRAFFEARTIAGLGRAIQEARNRRRNSDLSRIDPVSRQAELDRQASTALTAGPPHKI